MERIEPQEVRAHLDRIFASKGFAESDRLRRFLRFTVESKLAEQHERVKEYVLGREVFDRQDGYDPRLDPIVRVEARRLRAKLQEYYNGAGRDEPLRFEYEKGSYVPVFRRVEVASKPAAPARIFIALAAAICVAGIVAAAFYVSMRPNTNDRFAAIPIRWIQPNPGDLDTSDAGLAEAVNADLGNRKSSNVLAWPVILEHRDQDDSLQRLAADMGVGKLAVIIVRNAKKEKRVTVFLIDARTGRKLRVNEYFRPELSSFAAQRSLAHQIGNDLAQQLQI